MGRPKKKDLPDLSHLAAPGQDLPVRVTPKAGRNTVTVVGDLLKVAVTAAPENGKANDAVRDILATALGLAPSRLDLIRGATSRDKLFRVTSD
ncbi:DUF167 domain-containing protein [Epibacterium sp. SM1979]|uniref:UPF0235 protein GFB49_05780 n=1 Tax=Tritonibacter litoralis TaxID=2662264 RepID=A0A843YAJ1_9RHOB|nr:DUF167 domain-containing protein [Tritonibacter litoralis]MQQ07956.1 DUF167 domain-containing protein [Tritonibacter litoralis]